MNNKIKQYYAFALCSNMLFIGAVLVPFFTEWGHISLFQVQVLQSWFSVWLFIFDVPTGIIADRLGRKYTLALGTMVSAIGTVLYGSIPHLLIFFIAEFLLALGTSLVSGADEALLYEILKESGKEHESKKYFGKAQTFHLIGIFIGAIFGGVLAYLFGLNMAFVLSAIPLILASIIAWQLSEPSIHNKPLVKESVFKNMRSGYSFFLTHKKLRLLALDSIVVSLAGYFVIWYYQPLLQNIGVSIALFGLFHALLVMVQIIASSNFTFLEKVFGSTKEYLRFSAFSTGISFLLVALMPNIITVLLFIVLAGGLGLSRGALISSYMNKFIPSQRRATILSSISTFKRMSIAVSNPIVGFIAAGSLPIALCVLGLLPLALFFFSPIEHEMFE